MYNERVAYTCDIKINYSQENLYIAVVEHKFLMTPQLDVINNECMCM